MQALTLTKNPFLIHKHKGDLRKASAGGSAGKDQQARFFQCKGFYNCINLWHLKNFNRDINSKVIHNLVYLSKDIPINKLPKWFKFQLAWNFSYYEMQELPTGFEPLFLFKLCTKICQKAKAQIRSKKGKHDSRRTRLLWDLMQSKSIANVVPNSMISDAYASHRDTMGKVPEQISEEVKEQIRLFIQPFVQRTLKSFKPLTVLPTKSACFESKRSVGGHKGQLFENLVLTNEIRKYYGVTRMDPVVIHLEGEPGVGKSHLVSTLCDELLNRFCLQKSDVYSRCAGVKHWDGYQGQFITVIDDLAVSFTSQTDIEDDRVEFYKLCSNVDYVLPMAKLQDKGMKFTSSIIIVTSNKATSILNGLSTPSAYMRRLSPTYCITRNKQDQSILDVSKETYKMGDTGFSDIAQRGRGGNSYPTGGWVKKVSRKDLPFSDIIDLIIEDCCSTYVERRDSMEGSLTMAQQIENSDMYLHFKSPPSHLPEVMSHAIPEPLKVRMITKPNKNAFVLKPLQLAMMEALKTYNCFEPCWNPNYTMCRLRSAVTNDTMFLSGDYTNATDDLNFHASQVVMTELAEAFKSEYPIISQWIGHEGGSHLVHYPPSSGLSPVLQNNGQLMGSLLSFPILCILNAFTMCKATGKSLEDVPALFHGDDIAATVNVNEFIQWKLNAREIGLSLSIGKNYLSSKFVSIDSRLYQTQVDNKLSDTPSITGKYKLAYREDDGSLTVTQALLNGFSKEILKRVNPKLIGTTPESLDVHLKYGGLSPLESDIPILLSKKDHAVYITKLESKANVRQISRYVYELPLIVSKYLNLKEISAPIYEWDKELSNSDFIHRFKRNLKSIKTRTTCTIGLTELDTFKRMTVHCVDHSFEDLIALSQMLVLPKNCNTDMVSRKRKANPYESIGLRKKFRETHRLCNE